MGGIFRSGGCFRPAAATHKGAGPPLFWVGKAPPDVVEIYIASDWLYVATADKPPPMLGCGGTLAHWHGCCFPVGRPYAPSTLPQCSWGVAE